MNVVLAGGEVLVIADLVVGEASLRICRQINPRADAKGYEDGYWQHPSGVPPSPAWSLGLRLGWVSGRRPLLGLLRGLPGH